MEIPDLNLGDSEFSWFSMILPSITQRFLQSFEAHARRPQTVIKLNNYHDANEVDDTNREVLTMSKL